MARKKKQSREKPSSATIPQKENTVVREPKINALTRLDNALSTRKYWLAAGVFVVSLILNTIYFQQAKNTPLESMHRWEQSDMAFFDQSARWIAEGNWLCDTVLHPYHSWHDAYTALYFEQFPETAAPYYSHHLNEAGIPDTMAARRAFVNDMFQGKVYHQEPMYVYLVALTYRLFGPDTNWVYVWQLFLIALTNVLVFLVGRRYFGTLAGLSGALIVAVSGPILVYGMTILRTSLTAFLTLLMLYSYQKMLDDNTRKNQLLFGVVSGISLLSQSYLLLFLLPAIAWYTWENRIAGKRLAGNLGVVMGAILLAMLPLFIRNAAVGAPVTSMASNGAITYILFNSSNAAPLETSYMHYPSTVKLMHESGGKLFPAAVACLRSFDGMGSLLKMYRQKIDGLFMWFEVPNNMSYYMYKEFSPLLKALPAPYWLIAPLGISGLFFGFWRFRWRFLPFFFMLLASASPMIISASLARYRVPFVMLLTLLATFFILDFIKNVWTLKWKPVLAGTILIALTWMYTSNIRDKRFFTIYASDIMPVYLLHYKDRLMDLEKAEKYDEYRGLTTELVSYLPDYFLEVRNTHRAFSSNEANCCRTVAKIIGMHAAILKTTGDQKESAKFSERVTILNAIADAFDKRVGRKPN